MFRRRSSEPGVRGPAGASFRTLLRNYGFHWPGREADHVQDLAFSGPDEFHNLWLLRRSTNRNTARHIYNQNVEFQENNRRREVSVGRTGIGKWFKVKMVINR